MRRAIEKTKWFVAHQGSPNGGSDGPHVLLVDSIEHNMEDLLAAWCALRADQQGAITLLGGDQCDPERVGEMVARAFLCDGLNTMRRHLPDTRVKGCGILISLIRCWHRRLPPASQLNTRE